jgi:putative copper resistance protein D
VGADLVVLWLQSAAMADRSLSQGWAFASEFLRDTHFGHAWVLGFGALLLAMAAASLQRDDRATLSSRCWWTAVAALALFAWSRAAVSHAAGQGDLSAAVLVEGVHLLSAALWIGVVLVAAVVRLPTPPKGAAIRADATHWVRSLSSTATAALIGVLVTGSYNAWRSIPSLQAMLEESYGHILIAKLGLVLVAMCLGGFNRFKVMPHVLRQLQKSRPRGPETMANRRFGAVLLIEAVVLCVTILAAALLSSAEPIE